ncbi:pentapeptide repeat-containing protein [Amycolatopsis sp. SID8362]|uniref:pentapeptide repeat-containing protein n=1 Tax=Amycolatopsis sp. SID8362 TaxID=2690346 RepID=UPI00136CD252|nr:pentapeptide repeat-containing protein [Amycolatopsis sp. SID8362]NBH04094.1 pentapeptide repeat-containing protein [Amycolatopsis sp. SID8362]NED40793.1 pentapeptide repeat-containing protein [Amycolatopsis sp. SID8362]
MGIREKSWSRLSAAGAVAAGGSAVLTSAAVVVNWPAIGQWARPHAFPLGLAAGGGLLLLVGTWSLRRGLRPRGAGRPPLSWWVVAAAAVVVIAVAWGCTQWLLTEANLADDVGAARVEAIKTGLGIGAGTTGIFALMLAVRRQWHSEVDAAEKNTTELYTKAADQLGSDKAPVRLAGLYALERLAQDNPRQRQSIVNVFCAYLRMPFDVPQSPEERAEDKEIAQEREVRLAAQRILFDHLRADSGRTFWDQIDLDLTKAYLINVAMSGCVMRSAQFAGATFTGTADFSATTFTGTPHFRDATFTGEANFTFALFLTDADFGGATFGGSSQDTAQFTLATFSGDADFGNATFPGSAIFRDARFRDDADFRGTTFAHKADFTDASFGDDAEFDGATLRGSRFQPWEVERR